MLDKNYILTHRAAVEAAARAKGIAVDVGKIAELDAEIRALQTNFSENQRDRKILAQDFRSASPTDSPLLRRKSEKLKTAAAALRGRLQAAEVLLGQELLRVPNIPWSGSPTGPDESANVVIRSWGEVPSFAFEPKDHVDLATKRGWVEFERARGVAGERAYALTNDALLLERAIHSYALDLLRAQGFRLMSVPVLVRERALVGSGFLPQHQDEIYHMPADDLYLAGTAEVALVGLYGGEVIEEGDLPFQLAGISTCFRREAGSSGRDVRGLLRVHQFEKVEQFVICRADPDESDRWHSHLLETAETMLRAFAIPYQVVECSTGDMGLGKRRMNDINSWFPSLQTYRETHSCSSLSDWQARRANIRYRDADGKVRYAYTLNNTAVATPRLLACLMENGQQADGTVRIPAVLSPYMNGRTHI